MNNKLSPQAVGSAMLMHDVEIPYFGRIVTPNQARKATIAYDPEIRERVKGQWMVSGDVSRAMFGRLRGKAPGKIRTRLTAFKSGSGTGYGVVTHQIDGYQHRFLLCLYDPPVREFLKATSHSGAGVGFLIGNDGGNPQILLDYPGASSEFVPLLSIGKEASEAEQQKAANELHDVLKTLRQPETVPSMLEQRVSHVCITLVIPELLRRQMAISLAAVNEI